MSLQEKDGDSKKATLKLSSASFKPKTFKPKTKPMTLQSPPTQNTTPEQHANSNPSSFGALPSGLVPEKNSNIMPFPSLLGGGTPGIDLN